METPQKKPGDALITIDGEQHLLRLTLGALAEIEEKIGEGNLDACLLYTSPSPRDS